MLFKFSPPLLLCAKKWPKTYNYSAIFSSVSKKNHENLTSETHVRVGANSQTITACTEKSSCGCRTAKTQLTTGAALSQFFIQFDWKYQ